jgi:hypothetical protein
VKHGGGDSRHSRNPGFGEDVKWRTGTEEHARDSLENVLFSICRFYELTGHFPHNITVVSAPPAAPLIRLLM